MALKRLADLKSRFLSEMSHELRSPLNSIRSLSGFLLDRGDGDLTGEQEKQVRLIRKAAEDLMGLVNDLLDLARVEAGKAVIRPGWFEIGTIFDGPARGRSARSSRDRPWPWCSRIRPACLRSTRTRGSSPRSCATSSRTRRSSPSGARSGSRRISMPEDRVVFSVTDSGIGIAAGTCRGSSRSSARSRIRSSGGPRGPGSGLPLSRKLAEVLGGSVTVRSEPGVGSTFAVTIPRVYRPAGEHRGIDLAIAPARAADPSRPSRPVS